MVKNLSIFTFLFLMLSAQAADTMTPAERFEEAVLENRVTLVDTLLKSGVDVNTLITSFSDTPALLIAAEEFNVPMMNVLVNHGVDVTATDWDGNTVLHALANSRYYRPRIKEGEVASVMRFFIEKGANASAKNNDRVTALSIVAERPSSSSCVDALMVDDLNDRKDALRDAIESCEEANILKLFLHGIPINQDHKEGAEYAFDSSNFKLPKKEKKIRHLIKHGTQSKYFVKHCFGEFRERLRDKRNIVQILKTRQIGKKK